MIDGAHSQTANPESAADYDSAIACVDGQDPHDQLGTNPVRSAVVVLAFVVHVAALIGYTALLTATLSSYFGQGLPTAFLMLALIFLAGAAVIVIAWDLSTIARSIIFVLTIAVFGITGIAGVVTRVAPPADGSAVEAVFGVSPYICLFLFPFLVAGVLLTSVRRPDVSRPAEGHLVAGSSARSSAVGDRQELRTARLAAPSIALAICALIIAVITFLVFVAPGLAYLPDWFHADWVIAVPCAVGTVAGLILLRNVPQLPLSPVQSTLVRIAGYLILLCGVHACVLSTTTIVEFATLGLGGVFLWVLALAGFFIAAIALPLIVRTAKPRAF